MNEYLQGWAASLAGLGLLVSSTLYWLGGRGNKWLRRFIAPAVLTAAITGTSLILGNFNFFELLVYPLLALGFCMGYGADTITEKIIKRFLYASVVMFPSGLLMCILIGGNAWSVFPFHLLVGYTSIYLGVKNPVVAPAEEALISTALTLGLLAYPFAS